MKRNVFAMLLTFVMVVSLFAGCGSKTGGETTGETIVATSPVATTEPQAASSGKVKTIYSPNFSIENLGNGIKKVIDGDKRELILVPKMIAEVPAEYKDSIVIRTPVENAVFMSDTQVCCFRDADQSIIDGIAGMSGAKENFIGFDSIQKAMDEGKIVSVGGGMGEPDYELLQSLNPDIVFVYTGDFGQSAIIDKLKELNINYAVDNEYMEKNYMARMEWARFLLTFFNADDAVDAQMQEAEKTLKEVRTAIEGLEKPKIAIFSVYDGQVNGTKSDSWLGSMIADMGGVNAFENIPEGPLTMEAAYDAIQDADVIIYSSTPKWTAGMPALLETFPLLKDCKAYENNRVFQYAETFWVSIDQSHVMASELASVLYPEKLESRDLNYFVKLDK